MICVDASVAAKWFLQEEWTDRARALLRETLNTDEPIVAPPLLPYEVTDILRLRLRASAPLPLEHALVFLDDFLSVPIELRNPPGLHRRALMLADTYGLPAAYDAHYPPWRNSLAALSGPMTAGCCVSWRVGSRSCGQSAITARRTEQTIDARTNS